MALAITVLSGCSGGAEDPEVADARMLSELRADPVMGVVISASPSAESTAVTMIRQSADGPDDTRDERLRDMLKPLVKEHLAVRAAHMDDHLVSRMAGLLSTIIMKRSALNDPKCLPDRETGGSFVDLVDPGERTSLLSEMVRTDPDYVPRSATREEASQVIAARISDAAARAGLTVDQVLASYSQPSAVQPSVTCKVVSGMFGSLAAMPPAQGAPIIRSMAKF